MSKVQITEFDKPDKGSVFPRNSETGPAHSGSICISKDLFKECYDERTGMAKFDLALWNNTGKNTGSAYYGLTAKFPFQKQQRQAPQRPTQSFENVGGPPMKDDDLPF